MPHDGQNCDVFDVLKSTFKSVMKWNNETAHSNRQCLLRAAQTVVKWNNDTSDRIQRGLGLVAPPGAKPNGVQAAAKALTNARDSGWKAVGLYPENTVRKPKQPAPR